MYINVKLIINNARLIFGNVFILPEYNFERSLYTACEPRGDFFHGLVGAEKECKVDKQCQGVLVAQSSEPSTYYLCPRNSTTSLNISDKDYLLKKILTGRGKNKCNTSMLYTFLFDTITFTYLIKTYTRITSMIFKIHVTKLPAMEQMLYVRLYMVPIRLSARVHMALGVIQMLNAVSLFSF